MMVFLSNKYVLIAIGVIIVVALFYFMKNK